MNDNTVKMLNNLSGWESLDLDGEHIKELQAQQEKEGRDLASLFHQAFVQNEAGARVLEIMMKQTLLKPTVTPTASEFAAGIREGRADMVRQILLNIELAGGA